VTPDETGGRFPPARRSMGQNFLVDGNLRRRIVEEARVAPGETVLEIGPGRGALTEGLARGVKEKGGRLVLVELDRELARRLSHRFRERPDVTVIQADILELNPAELTSEPGTLKVVGNIPYNVTTPIIFHLLKRPRPAEILLMVQREVAQRIAAEPGSGEYGALSVGVQSVATVERVLKAPPEVFRPRPKVHSEVIRIRPLEPPPLDPDGELALRRLTRALFQWRRKQLRKTLRDHPDLEVDRELLGRFLAAAGAQPTDRPETVFPAGFVAMARLLS